MSIKGLSDQLRFPRLGKIRLGIKAKNEKGQEYPKAVDYFVCDNLEFQEVYPERPKVLDICFPTDNPEDWASQFYRAYSRTRGLTCRGDGETCNRLIDASTGESAIADSQAKKTAWKELPCQGRECEYYKAKTCREMMFLQFLLPKVRGLGIWQLDTSSQNSIININSAVELLRKAKGHIAMVPLRLSVVPLEVSPEGRKKTVYVLQLDIPMRLAELRGSTMLPDPEDLMPEDLYLTEEQQKASQEAETEQVEEVEQEQSQETEQGQPKAEENELVSPPEAHPEPAAMQEAQPSPSKGTSKPPENLRITSTAALLKACHQYFNMTTEETFKALGVDIATDIVDLQEAWAKIYAQKAGQGGSLSSIMTKS